jgi:hypothetical protein
MPLCRHAQYRSKTAGYTSKRHGDGCLGSFCAAGRNDQDTRAFVYSSRTANKL